VFSSFNIRKLSKSKNRERELDFMSRFCARCDLIAIQKIQDSLDGLIFLQERVTSEGEFGLVVSDITGKVPGKKGLPNASPFYIGGGGYAGRNWLPTSRSTARAFSTISKQTRRRSEAPGVNSTKK